MRAFGSSVFLVLGLVFAGLSPVVGVAAAPPAVPVPPGEVEDGPILPDPDPVVPEYFKGAVDRIEGTKAKGFVLFLGNGKKIRLEPRMDLADVILSYRGKNYMSATANKSPNKDLNAARLAALVRLNEANEARYTTPPDGIALVGPVVPLPEEITNDNPWSSYPRYHAIGCDGMSTSVVNLNHLTPGSLSCVKDGKPAPAPRSAPPAVLPAPMREIERSQFIPAVPMPAPASAPAPAPAVAAPVPAPKLPVAPPPPLVPLAQPMPAPADGNEPPKKVVPAPILMIPGPRPLAELPVVVPPATTPAPVPSVPAPKPTVSTPPKPFPAPLIGIPGPYSKSE